MSNIEVTPVEGGTPITANWGNQVRQDLIDLDTRKLSTTGGAMSGTLNMSGNNIANAGNIGATGYATIGGRLTVAEWMAATGAIASDVSVRAGNDPLAAPGAMIHNVGYIRSQVGNDGVNASNLRLDRTQSGGAAAVGQDLATLLRLGVIIGTIRIQSGSSVSFNTTSDYRMKHDLGPITSAGERLMRLRPRRIVWRTDETNTAEDGWLAHEVAEAVPEAVSGERDAVFPEGHEFAGQIDPQQLDATKLLPLVTAALQEALTEIARLRADVDQLTNQEA